MATSAWVGELTTVVAVAVLFAGFTSFVVGATFAIFEMIVPDTVPAITLTTNGNCALVPDVTAAKEQTPALPGQQLIPPVPPTAGIVGQVQPVGIPSETKVVCAGTASVNVTPVTDAGPPFATV